MKIIKKYVITGCESEGTANSPYLTRYAFPRLGPIRMLLHVFHRSDINDMHNHPWPFVSIILWRGYIEHSRCTLCNGKGYYKKIGKIFCKYGCSACDYTGVITKRIRPFSINYRKAEHAHRVELINGKPAVTLVFKGARIERPWGFYTKEGFKDFKTFFEENGCPDYM